MIIKLMDRWGNSHYIDEGELYNEKRYVYQRTKKGKRKPDNERLYAEQWIMKDNLVYDKSQSTEHKRSSEYLNRHKSETNIAQECKHADTKEGERTPLRYGTASTEICLSCGAYRTLHHKAGRWILPATLKKDLLDAL